MVRPEGLEPSTAGLEGRCSIQLSYGRLATAARLLSSLLCKLRFYRYRCRETAPRGYHGSLRSKLLGNRAAVTPGRGREIRTPDILLPKQARYQTALYPERTVAVDVHFYVVERPPFVADRIIRTGFQSVKPASQAPKGPLRV